MPGTVGGEMLVGYKDKEEPTYGHYAVGVLGDNLNQRGVPLLI